MKALTLATVALIFSATVHAGTTPQYQESYDADGNRTWTKFKADAPVPLDYQLRTVQTAPSTGDSLLAAPVVGIEPAAPAPDPYQSFRLGADSAQSGR
ncbi:MAG: hypothetical protein R3E86_13795 [Pseudomonadales bacterium]